MNSATAPTFNYKRDAFYSSNKSEMSIHFLESATLAPAQANVLLHSFEELNRTVPAGK
jgi:hypothetical protein